nr:Protein CPn_0742/CP_0003/CPj0742/CpB0770 [Chlamydia pneumoniae]CRI42865.1 Protein CPn_0742/CP_0003/CPj0742/CpB0770 [Chlamydia pneumoniae]CRI43984.1 Protein CPn_0742/CP_0003/CPj0742/CpB0770 [Chlamydia pneumoniae]CRI47370.1 Protein CPn_0742/CP_0003/CPj0742/CpB0770 [Chlamydia pneumoniae]CRI51920.1 Protein CPn_0742/CP_0003/CPj0742/CpB0770 [Chlamydia pneumoniae]
MVIVMNSKSAQKIIDSIKQILTIYNIDFDPSFGSSLSSDSDADYEYLITKTQEKIQELDKRAQEILTQTGMSKEQMEVFANNPDNFSPEEWLALEKVRSSCDEYRKETENLINEITLDLHPTKESKRPKQKLSSTKKNKKKNWIPL